MSLGAAETFGVSLIMLWGVAGAVALGRSVAKSPSARELAAAVRRMNLAAKGALVAGLVGAVAIGGTKPGGSDPQRLGQRPLSVTRTVASTNTPPFALVEVRTNGISLVGPSTNAVVSEAVRRRGTSEGGEWIEADTPFFRWGTNLVSRVFASPAVLSLGTMRHPALGAELPDGTSAESLIALRMPLGLAPEANWSQLAAPSRFWHQARPSGRVFTWENALLDRQPDRLATIQIETRADGDFSFRYDFSPATLTNGFFAGAQLGPAAIEALGVRGGVTNAATVYRVNGAHVPSGVSVADLFAAPSLELRWKSVAGLGNLSGDTDGDGLTDWDEIFRYDTDPNQSDTDGDSLSDAAEVLVGANPLNADENADSIPDGVPQASWTADPLWPANAPAGAQSISISLNSTIPVGASASLVVGGLCIPLRSPGAWTLALVPGELYPFRLHANGATADLSIAPATNTPPQRSGPPLRSAPAPFPFWTDDPDGVFDGPTDGGSGGMAVPTLELTWVDPGDGSHVVETSEEICLHGVDEALFAPTISPEVAERVSLDNLTERGTNLVLSVPESGRTFSGSISFESGSLEWGSLTAAVSAHRCDSEYAHPYCSVCGHYQPDDLELAFRSPLTLKHDNQTSFSIVHANSVGETHTNGVIEIRYKNGDGAWWVLGNETDLQPWTARFPGRFEVRGKIDANGSGLTTPVHDLIVRYPGIDEIRLDPDVIHRAELEWQAALADCTTNSGLTRERGYWIVLDTRTNRYGAEQPFQGAFFLPGERPSSDSNGRPPDRWSDPSDKQAGIVVAVAGFHTHVPTTLWPTNLLGRQVGPSEEDGNAAKILQMPGLVFDYAPDPLFSKIAQTNAIPRGWPANSPARLYPITSPERRPLQ